MNLGLFMMPLHPPEKDRTQCFEEDIGLVVSADRLGLAEAWVGQHLSLLWEPIPANDLFLANVLPRTQQIRLGTGVTILPQHHPANVAVRLAMLDHLSRGRLNCGFGQGGVPTDWELFNLPDGRTQGLMTVEGIDMVLKLWHCDPPFDLRGNYWHIRIQSPNNELGMGQLLRPYQKPHPPIAMSIIKPGSMAARMAGERGYLPLSTNLVTPAVLLDHWQTYCAGAAERGGPVPSRSKWRVARSIFIGETTEQAWEHARNGTFARSFGYLIELLKASRMLNLFKEHPDIPDAEVTPEYVMKLLCIIGDVKEVTRQLKQLWEFIGGFGTLLMIAHDWDDKARWMRSLELLAREVVPALPSI